MNHLRSTALIIAKDYFESNDPTLSDRYARTYCRMVKKANEQIHQTYEVKVTSSMDTRDVASLVDHTKRMASEAERLSRKAFANSFFSNDLNTKLLARWANDAAILANVATEMARRANVASRKLSPGSKEAEEAIRAAQDAVAASRDAQEAASIARSIACLASGTK